MTPYELAHLAVAPFLPVLYSKARHEIKALLAAGNAHPARVLDVGGRKSPYTIGLPAEITLLDIPRQTETQKQLHLGVNNELLRQVRRRRSNIVDIVLQDMTQCTLPSESFDGVICVEVIEHVAADDAFVSQIARALKPGGWLYLTTPNGDYLRNEGAQRNPDHVRHYRRAELARLLSRYFHDTQVTWGVHTGRRRVRGLRSLSWQRPLPTLNAMVSNLLSHIESRGLDNHAQRTAHLFAVACK